MNAPNEQLSAWDRLCRPPKEALKQIKGGRLSGMTDVNPQWRYKAMHDVFGPVGQGWKYEVTRIWTEPGLDGQVFLFAQVNAWIRTGDSWSDPIPGIGGSMLLEKDKTGIHHNDEAPKMAVTDALSVALKMLGVAADIYAGRWDGTKYKDEPRESSKTQSKATLESHSPADQTKLQGMAMDVLAAFESSDEEGMAAYLSAKTRLDADGQVALWHFFDSKTRAYIKKLGQKKDAPTADEIISQA